MYVPAPMYVRAHVYMHVHAGGQPVSTDAADARQLQAGRGRSDLGGTGVGLYLGI